MTTAINAYILTHRAAVRVPAEQRLQIAKEISAVLPQLVMYPESLCAVPGGLLLAARAPADGEQQRKILAIGKVEGFSGITLTLGGLEARCSDRDRALHEIPARTRAIPASLFDRFAREHRIRRPAGAGHARTSFGAGWQGQRVYARARAAIHSRNGAHESHARSR